MKKYILSLLIGTALLSSCLDVDIVDRVEKEDGFFKTEDHALAAINGVYSTLYAFAYHKTNWAIILPTYEDAMFSTGNAVPATVSNTVLVPLQLLIFGESYIMALKMLMK